MKISVVIPMYNSQETILQALGSILVQDFLPFEIIVINDGSSDGSEDIVSDFINAHPDLNIKLVSKVNEGVSKARNDAMKMASGDWIAFLDSDDIWLPQKLSSQIKVIQNNHHISFIGCTRNNEKITKFLWYTFSKITLITPKMLLLKNFFATPTVLFQKNIIDTVGYFDENQNHCEDANYWIRIASSGYDCFLLNESLVVTGGNKPHFGHIGLSSNLKQMAIGDRLNVILGYRLSVINVFGFFFLYFFSWLKYFRRIVIVKFLR
ncbi:glycosyltransferase family 2 protein [Flavobacterium psychrophilum]|uniref:glycosyltransferase family 2 protein n=1 Tax=Flavobacterium psychrophilum TaxID=96345 RepID=UPI001D05E441|nr:glycosyltransferase family 2 protein [Flavobacterium psychrophilum]ELV7524842.1 glycosyltransferase family 2 protein [Flavobacterium psychrophilum]ELY1978115.1 glycosyltransferase family 2 protein [Flavobacterium psychrophilum]ELY2016276.1 glycosyltransferase family 2 protein [Flavobacterium psychrophilum]MCB6061236.1 glycosyltransferase family 2 protein [Flavobacterium psychrophilum]